MSTRPQHASTQGTASGQVRCHFESFPADKSQVHLVQCVQGLLDLGHDRLVIRLYAVEPARRDGGGRIQRAGTSALVVSRELSNVSLFGAGASAWRRLVHRSPSGRDHRPGAPQPQVHERVHLSMCDAIRYRGTSQSCSQPIRAILRLLWKIKLRPTRTLPGAPRIRSALWFSCWGVPRRVRQKSHERVQVQPPTGSGQRRLITSKRTVSVGVKSLKSPGYKIPDRRYTKRGGRFPGCSIDCYRTKSCVDVG